MKHLSRALIPASILAAQSANLLIQLAVPRILSPDEFAAFSLSWAYAQFLVIFLFEWIRNATIRFSVGENRLLSLRRRRVLKRLYMTLAGGLLTLAAFAFALGQFWAALLTLGAAAVYTASRGLLDGAQSYARARFLNGAYALTWVATSILSLLLTVFFAWLSGKGVIALLGMSLAFLLSLSFHYTSRLFGRLQLPQGDREQLAFIWRYGAFIALTAMLSAALPPVIRSLAVIGIGAADSAGLLFALDLSQKVIAAIGMVFSLMFLQYAIRAVESSPREVALRKVTVQTSGAAAVIFPAGLGLYLLQRDFAELLTPAPLMPTYTATIGLACLSASVYSFRSYGVDSLFMISGRSRLSVWGPLLTLIVAVLWIAGGAFMYGFSLNILLAGQVVGLLSGTVVSMYLAKKESSVSWPIRDFCLIGIGCAVMATAMRLVPGAPGYAHGIAATLAGGLAYAAFAWAANLCGLRSTFASIRRNA